MTMPDPKDGAEPAGAWAQSAKLAFRFLFLAVCLAAIGWSVSNFRQVPPDSQAVVLPLRHHRAPAGRRPADGLAAADRADWSSCPRQTARSSSGSISRAGFRRSAAIS